MIRITSDQPPIVYQVDNYTLPRHVTGVVQWNGRTREFEVNDGEKWIPIDPTVQLRTSSEVQEILNWAQQRMREENKVKELLETNVALRDAHDKYETIKHLVLKEQQ